MFNSLFAKSVSVYSTNLKMYNVSNATWKRIKDQFNNQNKALVRHSNAKLSGNAKSVRIHGLSGSFVTLWPPVAT